jgi:predicted DNA-binding protein
MDLDALSKNTGSESPVHVRWVISHLLEETARHAGHAGHAGHADILRELIDGETGR